MYTYSHHIIGYIHTQRKQLKEITLIPIGHVRTHRYALRPGSAPRTEINFDYCPSCGTKWKPGKSELGESRVHCSFGS